jgi:hypothetical protein
VTPKRTTEALGLCRPPSPSVLPVRGWKNTKKSPSLVTIVYAELASVIVAILGFFVFRKSLEVYSSFA